MMEPDWIRWGRALQAIAQTGLHFTQNPYDVERYEQIRDLASEMFAAHSNSQPEVILDLFSQETGYATPKVDVRGVVFREGKILLVQEVLDQNRWTLPGGWADVNETPSQATIREIFEESGFETKVIKLLAVYDRAQQGHKPLMPYHVYKLFFLCEIVSGQATPSHETSGIAFFGENEIPELSISRVLPQQIQRFFHHASHFDWPTEFD